jgi:flagellar biosynthesis/type III secretory pathway ATPase
VRGSNPRIDKAIDRIDAVRAFLLQPEYERVPMDVTLAQLRAILHFTEERTP